MSMKRVVVTGGAGFIGSHLVERLLTDGHVVIVLDTLPVNTRAWSLSTKERRRFRWYECDLTNRRGLSVYFRGIDWVFHLSGRSDIVPSITDPVSYHAANVTATVNVLEASRKTGVKRFIYAASSSCYGIPDIYPTPETAQMKPQYPYALTKYIAELYVLHWAHVYKVPAASLRLFNVYGPRSRVSDDYGPVFSTFMAQKLAGEPFTVVGDGTQTRDFTYISDVVDACITIAKSSIIGEVFNVGSGGTYRINDLVMLVGGPVVHIPKRPGEPDQTWADISKIRKMTGWKPKISFEAGVKKVIDHIDDWRNAPVWKPKTIAAATKDWFAYLRY